MQPGFKYSDLPPMVEGGRYRSKTSFHTGDSLEPCDFWCGDAPQEYRDAFPEYKAEIPVPEEVKEKPAPKPRKKKSESTD